jgi:hypothetical protein
VQLSVPAPVTELLPQLSPVSTGTPLPFRVTEVEDPLEALLAIINFPATVPVAAGLKCKLSVKLLLALTVTGKLLEPLTEKDCPVTFSWEISTGADPWFTRVTLVLAVCPTATGPKSTVLVEAISVPVAAPNPVFFNAMDPPQPLRARLQKKDSSPIRLKFKWRIIPPDGRDNFIGARTKLIAKAN